MIQYTTPTVALTVKGVSLISARVMVTFADYLRSQRWTFDSTSDAVTMTEIQNEDESVDTKIEIALSQEDTAKFVKNASLDVQVNWIDSDGKRNATMPGKICVHENLLKEVISYD